MTTMMTTMSGLIFIRFVIRYFVSVVRFGIFILFSVNDFLIVPRCFKSILFFAIVSESQALNSIHEHYKKYADD